ncbi:MAG: hypothetical protein RLZZ76_278 [Candidatus Parcubacteria bacterium]|jgi:hypothetical protein
MQTKFVQILVLGIVFILGFVLGKMNVATPADTMIESAKESYTEMTTKTPQESGQTKTTQGTGATVSADALTESQKKMLESFGVDTNAITVTTAMIACAEAKLGAARVEEIKNGATPSMLEGASLIACYK